MSSTFVFIRLHWEILVDDHNNADATEVALFRAPVHIFCCGKCHRCNSYWDGGRRNEDVSIHRCVHCNGRAIHREDEMSNQTRHVVVVSYFDH